MSMGVFKKVILYLRCYIIINPFKIKGHAQALTRINPFHQYSNHRPGPSLLVPVATLYDLFLAL